MATDFFQYQVNKLWYRLYWLFLVLCNMALLGGYIVAQFLPAATTYADMFHIDAVAFVFGGVGLFYLLVIYWAVLHYSLPFASLIGSMILTLAVLNGLANTDQGLSTLPYVLVWLIMTGFSGFFGLPILFGTVFASFLYVVLHSNFDPARVSKASLVLLAGNIAVALASYLFWRNRFISLEDQKLSQLSGILQSKQQQADVLIHSITDGIIVTNTENKITLINPAAAKMTGWSTDEAFGVDASLVAIFSKESGEEIPQDQNPLSTVLHNNKPVNQILKLNSRDEKQHVVSLAASPVTLPNSTEPMGTVAVIRDVSQERAAEQQRADFISTASHEMRTPVAAIEGYLALALNQKVSTIDTRARGYLEKAHTSAQHLGKLFQDLLTSSKAEDGRLSNHPQVVEMGAFLQQLTDGLKFSAEKKGLFVEFLVGANNEAIDATNKEKVGEHVLKPLYYVHVDPERIREVITNIFDNACKYTEQGKISIGLTGDAGTVQMYIKDTGAGIPAEDVPHLFQKFYRVDNSATRTIGGTGLGLFICRKIVELYKGRVWVESEVGKGSTFYINLPRLDTARAESLQQSEAANTPPIGPSGTSAKA